MFSSRLPWHLRTNRLAQLLEAKQRAGDAILDLTESNPTRAGFSYPAQEIRNALAGSHALHYDPAPAGSAEAREAVSDYYRARGEAVPSERILLTASTSEAYSFLFKLLADPGDEILVPRPSYPLFEFLAGLESVRMIQYPLIYRGGWAMDLDALALASSARTRAVILVNPNNPTGSFVKRSELETLTELARERKWVLISDEVFADYAFTDDAARVRTLAGAEDAPAVCLSGLSKVAGLPQMKLSWMVLAGPVEFQREARERLEWIADSYLSVGTPVQQALPRLLEWGAGVREQIARRVRQNLDVLQHAVKGTACQTLDVEGGWYAIVQVPRTRSEEEWCVELLERDGVRVQPGFFYDFESEAFLVLSLLTPPETFQEGVERLLARVRDG